MELQKPSPSQAPPTSVLERFAYASALAGGVAGAFVVAVELALARAVDVGVVALASAGTIAVYNVDRLRDVARDRGDSPARTAFVERNRGRLRGLLAGALLVCGAAAPGLEPAGLGLCAAVLGLGLAHRRLKRLRGIKTFYLVTSWLAITVGLPLLGVAHPRPPDEAALSWVLWILAPTLTANILASNLERAGAGGATGARSRRRRLSLAVACAGFGLASAIVAPAGVRPLGAIAALQFTALVRYRDDEAYRATIVDGSLLLGALLAIGWLGVAGR